MQIIENEKLIVRSTPEGAELCSIFNKETKLEYLWQAGAAWPKHAPVLFPIVGQLKDNIYYHNDKEYRLDRHGFARTKTFQLSKNLDHVVEYKLTHSDETLACFPFEFDLRVSYELIDASLKIIYTVINVGNDAILFSIGAHPAFKVPLTESENYEDYYLEFNQLENSPRWLLENGLLNNKTLPCLEGIQQLTLKRAMFYEDALVFKKLESNVINLKNKKNKNGLSFHFNNYPYFGVWAARDANFICLEPWHGIADDVNSDQQLKNKEGIITLQAGDKFYCEYTIAVF